MRERTEEQREERGENIHREDFGLVDTLALLILITSKAYKEIMTQDRREKSRE
jgi:hypothetical protein